MTTTSTEIDPNGYAGSVDGGAGQAIAASGTVTISDVGAGPHTVTLGDLAENCSITAGTNPQAVTVSAGETAEATFVLTCTVTTAASP